MSSFYAWLVLLVVAVVVLGLSAKYMQHSPLVAHPSAGSTFDVGALLSTVGVFVSPVVVLFALYKVVLKRPFDISFSKIL